MIAPDYSDITFRIMKCGSAKLRISYISPLQSLRQFIRNRLNEPQRKSLIKAPRERVRSGNVHTSKIFNETNRIHGGRRVQVELSRSRNRHDYTRVREEEARKRRRGRRKVRRKGAREGERQRRRCTSACTCR